MAEKAVRYVRIIFLPGGVKVVDIGNGSKQSCTTLPDSLQEARELIKEWKVSSSKGETHQRGAGNEFILNNDCELKYYLNKKLVAHLK